MNKTESPRGIRLSRIHRALITVAVGAAVVAACVPPPAPPTSTTTTTAAPTTTEAPTTTTTIPTWDPQIVVTQSSSLNPDGQTVTVSGSGFDPNANVGTRPPLSGQRSGVYVTFGKFATAWRPSTGAVTATRQVISQVWALPEPSFSTMNPSGTNPQYTLLGTDGSFSVTLNVAPSSTGTNAYGFAVYPGSGASNASHEILVGATFSPKVTVSKTTDLSEAGEPVTVTGIGFLPSAVGTRPPLGGQPAGAYATFGRFGDPWRPSTGAPSSSRQVVNGQQVWALPQASYDALGGIAGTTPINPDGSFTITLTPTPGGTSANPYAIAVYPGSGANNPAQEFLFPASFAAPI